MRLRQHVWSKGADVFVIRTVNCLPEKLPLTIILLGENLWMEVWKLNPNGLCQSSKQTKNPLNIWLGDPRAGLNSFNKKQLSRAGRESNYDSSVIYIIA